jgi:adenylate kinase family enzyme
MENSSQVLQKRFVILMAAPGAGKSTQAKLLLSTLQQRYPSVIHLTTGGTFREFIKSESYLAQKAREEQNNGGLQPEFLAIWNWTNVFIKNLEDNTTVILDGAPRKVIETEAIHSLFPFLGYHHVDVVYLEVTTSWAVEHQKYREEHSTEKREDASSEDEIKRRVELFYKDVLPCIDLLKNDPRYHFHRINGEQTIEAVFEEIKQALHL